MRKPKEEVKKRVSNNNKLNLVSIQDTDRDKLIEVGTLVQQGKARWVNYSNDCHQYEILAT